MNVLTAPKFLTRHRDPEAPPLPAPQPREASPETTAFLDSVNRLREEAAYLRDENENLTRELKLANERIRMLDTELTNLRADHQILDRHDGDLMNSLDNIVTLIVAAQAKARDHAYAPPGSGNKTVGTQGDDLAAGVSALAAKLGPEKPTDA